MDNPNPNPKQKRRLTPKSWGSKHGNLRFNQMPIMHQSPKEKREGYKTVNCTEKMLMTTTLQKNCFKIETNFLFPIPFK